MRTIDDIIEDWKTEFGTPAQGQWGPYRFIDFKRNREYVLNLVQTLRDEGFTKEDLLIGRNQLKVVEACEAPSGKSIRKSSSIKKTKDMTASNWKYAIREIFPEKISVCNTESSSAPIREPAITIFTNTTPIKTKPEKLIEIDPKDRIKMDTSDISDNPLDLEFLKELGIEPDSVGNKNE